MLVVRLFSAALRVWVRVQSLQVRASSLEVTSSSQRRTVCPICPHPLQARVCCEKSFLLEARPRFPRPLPRPLPLEELALDVAELSSVEVVG